MDELRMLVAYCAKLNKLFCYIMSKMGDLQSLRNYARRYMEHVETLVTLEFLAIDASKHSIVTLAARDLGACSFLSNFPLEGLILGKFSNGNVTVM